MTTKTTDELVREFKIVQRDVDDFNKACKKAWDRKVAAEEEYEAISKATRYTIEKLISIRDEIREVHPMWEG